MNASPRGYLGLYKVSGLPTRRFRRKYDRQRRRSTRTPHAPSRRGETIPEANHASDATHGAAGNASEGVSGAGPVRSLHSSTVGDTSPGDALRGKRHAVTFPCALGASPNASNRRDTVPEANHVSDATRGVAGNASEGVSGAGPVRSPHSSTVGDTSPRDAFPASSNLVRGRNCVPPVGWGPDRRQVRSGASPASSSWFAAGSGLSPAGGADAR